MNVGWFARRLLICFAFACESRAVCLVFLNMCGVLVNVYYAHVHASFLIHLQLFPHKLRPPLALNNALKTKFVFWEFFLKGNSLLG